MINLPEKEYFVSGHNACQGCGAALAMRWATKAAGNNAIIVQATGCMEVISTVYPYTSWMHPWIHGAFENAPALASGIRAALRVQNKKTKILIIGGDGSTYDIGFQSLSGAFERNEDVCYVCYNNEGYMNCLSLDSMIMTRAGLKKITEIKKGSLIYAFNQETHRLALKKCVGIFNNGIKKVFELNTLHHSIKATSNHPFLALKRNGKGKKTQLVWKILAELKKGDEIIVLKNIQLNRKSCKFKSITLSEKGDYKVNKINDLKIPKISSPELMELLGLYVGDGWIRARKGEIGFALPENTKGSIRLMELYKKLFGKKLIQNNKYYCYIYSVNLARFIDSLGFGNGARNKIIPPWVFTLPNIEKDAFIKGLMLSDGYTIRNSYRYVSASYALLKTLRLLLQTMDYRVGKIHQQTKKKDSFCVYRQLLEDSTYGYICFSKKQNADISKYPSQIKQRDYLADNEFFSTERIVSISFVKEEPTLDLRVDGEHNFIADGIVVHNTGNQRSSATPKYADTTTTPFGEKVHGKMEWKKPLPLIMAAHGIEYVATASLSNIADFYNKVVKGLEKGPSYIEILTPCTPGWGINPSQTIKISKLAVNTGAFPIFEIEKGLLTINHKLNNPTPIKEYLTMQKRFEHLTETEINEIQERTIRNYEFLESLNGKRLHPYFG